MNKIKVLPENLANQIAAGEVVERPASVVKELLENSLDAGATRLTIEIELGGRRLMRISDDGEGMSRDDAILAFERHATSKIASLDDLARIGTLGFRGEALASIASVAKVELLSKNESDATATLVIVEGGRLLDVKDAARDRGTTISVRDLFFNTPARRKFMRSEATENYHLTSIVTHYALAHPEVAFTMTNNGREVIRVSPARDLRERAFQIFGAGLLESLLPIEGGREHVARISGFVSAPRERRTTRDSQYFFVNKRFVKDKTIAGGLLEGYRSVLPHGVYPVAFLFLDLPVEEIDVNVHPAKTEIRFRRGEAVKDVIAEAIRSALQKAGITGDAEISAEQPPVATGLVDQPEPQIEQHAIDLQPAVEAGEARAHAVGLGGYDSATSKLLDDAAIALRTDHAPTAGLVQTITSAPVDLVDLPPVNSAAKLARAVEPESLTSAKIQPVGQLHESFIIAVDEEGLLLVDQHVAHERILFDKYRHREVEREVESQNLLLPETIDLTPAQSAAFELIESELEQLGFAMMRLSGRTIAIKSIPTDLPAADVRNLFAEILDTIDVEKQGGAKSTLRDDIAASIACQAAIKINMKLTPEKMRWLIDRLLTTSSPTTCPHGRPVILRLSMKDIEQADFIERECSVGTRAASLSRRKGEAFHHDYMTEPNTQAGSPRSDEEPKLIRAVGVSGATTLNMIDMIGVGPFITMPLIIAAMGGPQAMIGWIVGAVLVMCDGLVWAELGAAMPKSGGPYNYLQEIYGKKKLGRLMSFLFIWQLQFSAPLSMASGCIGFALYATYIFPDLGVTLFQQDLKLTLPFVGDFSASILASWGTFVAIGICVFCVFLLYRKITIIEKLGKFLWLGVMAAIAWIIFGGLTNFDPALAFDFPPDAFTLRPEFFLGLGSAMLIAVYDYWGYYNVNFFAGEVKDPEKTIPRSIIISISAISAIYIVMNISILGVIPWREFMETANSDARRFVISVFIERLYGSTAGVIATLLIMWTAFASVFSLLLGYSRVPYAASLDGNYFKVFSKVHHKHRFPYVSLLAMGGIAALFCFLRLADVIAALVVIRILVQFLAQIVGVMILRQTKPDFPRPFRMWLYPLPALIAIAGFVFVMFSRPNFQKEIKYALVLIVLGLIIYLIRSYRRSEFPFGEEVVVNET